VLGIAVDPLFEGAPDEVLASFDRRRHAQIWSELLGRLAARPPTTAELKREARR
jgi:hypothetical protein